MLWRISKCFLRFGAGCALILIACSLMAQDVSTSTMPGVDFSKFHTYKWVKIPNVNYPDQITDTEIKNAINAQLSAKGFTMTDDEKADLYIGYQVSVSQQTQWNAYGMGGGIRWGGGMVTADQNIINTGTLVLDIYDPVLKQLIWTGRASKTIDPNNSQEKKEKNLNKAMQKLLKNFPPKAS